MTVVTRFAPSPTGYLHVGNLRTALVNWLLTRKMGGTFWLRLDDTDAERSRPEYANAIREDMAWLGIPPDRETRQSAHLALYEERFQELTRAGRIYPCYETPEELEIKRKVALGRGQPPVYDRAALKLSEHDRERLEAAGQRPHWRFKLDVSRRAEWFDLVRGSVSIDLASLSDPVIRRADGSFLYMLPSVIDDIAMGVTHVVRGEDHVSNSGVQIQMFEALGGAIPQFAHMALLASTEGALSKRLGSLGVRNLRGEGVEPLALAALLARIGTSHAIEPISDMSSLVEDFDFAHLGRATAHFDLAELKALNARTLHHLPYAAVADRLPHGMAEEAWDGVRPNLATIAEAEDWWQIITGPVAPAMQGADRDYLSAAAALLERLEWSNDIWGRWTAALKEVSGRKGKSLFLPLRQALTGRDSGPEMAALMPLIGRDEALKRLDEAAG